MQSRNLQGSAFSQDWKQKNIKIGQNWPVRSNFAFCFSLNADPCIFLSSIHVRPLKDLQAESGYGEQQCSPEQIGTNGVHWLRWACSQDRRSSEIQGSAFSQNLKQKILKISRVRHSVKFWNRKFQNGVKLSSNGQFCFSIYTECRSLKISQSWWVMSNFAFPFSLNADPCWDLDDPKICTPC